MHCVAMWKHKLRYCFECSAHSFLLSFFPVAFNRVIFPENFFPHAAPQMSRRRCSLPAKGRKSQAIERRHENCNRKSYLTFCATIMFMMIREDTGALNVIGGERTASQASPAHFSVYSPSVASRETNERRTCKASGTYRKAAKRRSRRRELRNI